MGQENEAAEKSQKAAQPNQTKTKNPKNWNFFIETLKLVGIMVHL